MTLLANRCVLIAVLAFMSVGIACSRAPQVKAVDMQRAGKLVFLTREGCVNTVTMRANFDAALQALGLSNEYQFINADTLAPSDPRAGYGTPTVLYENRDLFDMPEPAVPHPPAT